VVRNQPTSLGIFVGRAMMEKTRADLAVVNAGGIRDSLPAGPLTYKDVLTVHPFGNTLCIVDFSGKELLDYLSAVGKMSAGSGGFGHFAGIRLRLGAQGVKEASIGGKPVDPAKTYRMTVNNFVAAGGDGYPKLTGHPGYVDTGFVDADVLRAYITQNSPIKAAVFAPGDAVLRD